MTRGPDLQGHLKKLNLEIKIQDVKFDSSDRNSIYRQISVSTPEIGVLETPFNQKQSANPTVFVPETPIMEVSETPKIGMPSLLPSSDPEVFKPGFSGFKELQEVSDIRQIYKFKKKLGSGSFGTVYKGVYLKTGTPVAIKTINKDKIREKNNEYLQVLLESEIKLLTILEHPHIVRALGLCED